jgi:hypothetical protein
MERKNMKAGTDKNLQRAEAEDKKERQLLHWFIFEVVGDLRENKI